jgi:hypothetical protein
MLRKRDTRRLIDGVNGGDLPAAASDRTEPPAALLFDGSVSRPAHPGYGAFPGRKPEPVFRISLNRDPEANKQTIRE